MLFQRIAAVVVGAPIVLAALFCPHPWVFKVFVQLCATAALYEFFSMIGFSRAERLVSVLIGTGHGLFLLFVAADLPSEMLLLEILILVGLGFAFFLLIHPSGLEGIASRLGLFLLGQFYVATFASFVGLTRSESYGIFFVLILMGMTWLNDTLAYFVGHRWGERRLAPTVSPGKSLEGFLGGFLGSLCGFLIFWTWMDNPMSLPQGLLLVLLVGVLGPIGDLGESLIKRSFHVKDSGTLIPGHGGMLDRIDALLFTAPAVYYYAHFFG